MSAPVIMYPRDCYRLIESLGWFDTTHQAIAGEGFQRVRTFSRSQLGLMVHKKTIAQVLLYSKQISGRLEAGFPVHTIDGFVTMVGRLPTKEDKDKYIVEFIGDSLIRATSVGYVSEFKLTKRR